MDIFIVKMVDGDCLVANDRETHQMILADQRERAVAVAVVRLEGNLGKILDMLLEDNVLYYDEFAGMMARLLSVQFKPISK